VEIVDQFRAGALNSNADSFEPEEYNELNAKCSDKLQKELEVKPPKKRSNFNNFRGRKKFQLNNNWNYSRN
jgi:hypothetical protein